MEDQVIICPSCGVEIPLTEALFSQIREKLQDEVQEGMKEKERQFTERQKSLDSKESELEVRIKDTDQEIADKVNAKIEKIRQEEREKAQSNLSLEMDDLRNQMKEKDEKLEQARKNELGLRKRERELEEGKQALELELNRKLDLEKEKIRKDTLQTVAEKHELEVRDLKNQLAGMSQQIDELKRKAEQGSQQAQGEVLEIQLEDVLRNRFGQDNIVPVPKGMPGADVIQEVYDDTGKSCGKIIWESKRTKRWSEGWIDKLKTDQRKAKAEIAVILTTVLPKEVDNFDLVKGVWVTDFRTLQGLATALRLQLIQTAATKFAGIGKGQKMELLYGYLSGSEFRGRIESLVEAFTALGKDLQREKTAVTKMWAQREKQIQKVLENTVGMYGDMQGIIGASLPQIKQLEMKALPGQSD